MNSAEWAAWVQTVGSLIGLAIAVAVPMRIHFIDRRSADMQAKIVREVAVVRLRSLVDHAVTQAGHFEFFFGLYSEQPTEWKDYFGIVDNLDLMEKESLNLHLLGERDAVSVALLFACAKRFDQAFRAHQITIGKENTGGSLELEVWEQLAAKVITAAAAFKRAADGVHVELVEGR